MFLFYSDLFSFFSLGFCISHVNVTVLITVQGKYDPLLTLTQSFAPITLVQLYLEFYKWQIQIWEASCTDLIMPYFTEVIFACPKTVTLLWTSFFKLVAWKQHQPATSCMFLKLRLFLMARLTNGFLFSQTPAELCWWTERWPVELFTAASKITKLLKGLHVLYLTCEKHH